MSIPSVDVIVIGAGIHGACTALHSSQTGRSVIMLDRNSGGQTASLANAGGVRRLMRDPAELPLAMLAAERWRNLSTIVGSDCGYREVGQIKIAENEQELSILAKRASETRRLGYSFEELISPADIARLVPELRAEVSGGLIVETDGFADPFLTMRAYISKAVSNGVDFRPFHPVTDVIKVGGRWEVVTTQGTFAAEILVNCAGAWGAKIGELIGESLPITPEAPSMMVTEPLRSFIRPVLGAVSRKLSFKQLSSGALLIGGGYRGHVNESGDRSEINEEQLQLSGQTVLDLFPQLRNVKIRRCWSGVEGHTPDKLPIIGASKSNPNVIHAFGFSSHGFQLGPIVGKVISELIGGSATLSLTAFSPDRFKLDGLNTCT